MRILVKKFFIYIYFKLINNYFFVILIRKPFNTWILSTLKDKKTVSKDASIWLDESHHKTEWFSTISKPQEINFIKYILKNTDKDDFILDICCNQGRFLKYLFKNGYHNLYGVDIMKPAIDILKKSPEYMKGGINAECKMAQDYLFSCKNKSMDYAITYTASIELIHPNFKLFEELNRITRKGFIFVINENKQGYPRFYRYLIEKAGFKKVKINKVSPGINLLHFKN